MRVLLTTDTIGGVWTFTYELAQGLLKLGHAVALVSFGRTPNQAQSETMRALTRNFADFEYTPTEVPLEWMEQNERAWPEGKRVVSRIMCDFAPDILHASQFCFGRLSHSIPCLVTAHSDVLSWAGSTLAPNGIAQLESTASPKWLGTYRKLIVEGLTQATAVVAPTRWMAHEVTSIYELAEIPRVIPNGISPNSMISVQSKLQAITAGRLWDQAKGLAILSEIDAPFPIYVAGEQPVTLPSAATNWLGPMSHQDLLELFAQSAIYLATSVYEPFGLAPLEAAQRGCAIVARDIPTFREVWGDAALYFDSPAALQHLLTSLAAHPRDLEVAQNRARQRAGRYTSQAMTEQYLALYQELLATSTSIPEQTIAHA